MLKNLNLGKTLTKNEMRQVKGGRGCAYLNPTGNASGGPVVTYNVSMEEARDTARDVGGRWCCDSCGSASWYGI